MQWLDFVDATTAIAILGAVLGAGGITSVFGFCLAERKERRLRDREIGMLLERMNAADKINQSTDRMMNVFHNEYYDLLHPPDDNDAPQSQTPPARRTA